MALSYSAEELLRAVKAASEEVITEEELLQLLEEKRVRAYIGFEPSNVIHLGALVVCEPIIQLMRAGFSGVFLMADVHGWLNHKGELDVLKETAAQNIELLKKITRARGVEDSVVSFVLGSDYQLGEGYILELFKLARLVTASEARKSMDTISKKDVMHRVSSEIYALMQCIDIAFLKINVAVGGMDQRKIHVMAREYLRKLGHQKPVAIHTPIILGLDGHAKMSKSLENAIFLNDGEEDVSRKIYKAYCPEGVEEGNPVTQIVKHIIFPWTGGFEVAGNCYTSYSEFLADWVSRRVGAKALKDAVTESIISVLRKINSS
jgi:tyrosyl-tRNA synthetase